MSRIYIGFRGTQLCEALVGYQKTVWAATGFGWAQKFSVGLSGGITLVGNLERQIQGQPEVHVPELSSGGHALRSIRRTRMRIDLQEKRISLFYYDQDYSCLLKTRCIGSDACRSKPYRQF